MKAYIIQSGHFSQAGNFMGFSAKGEKIHIYKKDIIRLFPQVGIVYRCLGRYEKELVKLPFYCLAKEKEFDYMDHDGQKTGQKFTRLTAFVISDKEYEIKTAAVQDWADSKIKDLLDDIHNLKIDNETSYNKMAVYQIFASADATIYSRYPVKNTGIDQVLEVSVKNSQAGLAFYNRDQLVTQNPYYTYDLAANSNYNTSGELFPQTDIRRSVLQFSNADIIPCLGELIKSLKI